MTAVLLRRIKSPLGFWDNLAGGIHLSIRRERACLRTCMLCHDLKLCQTDSQLEWMLQVRALFWEYPTAVCSHKAFPPNYLELEQRREKWLRILQGVVNFHRYELELQNQVINGMWSGHLSLVCLPPLVVTEFWCWFFFFFLESFTGIPQLVGATVD